MSYRNVLAIVVVMGGLLALAGPAGAGVAVLDQSVKVDKAAGNATFSLDFGHAPDFYTVDAHGRVADSFQINISADFRGNPQASPTTVIRGDEIQFLNALAVRNRSPASTDPHSGGFGSIRGTVPFSVHGTNVSFTTPLSLIDAPNGMFSYYAFTMHNGATQAQAEARSVPLPSALHAAMLMLALGGTVLMCKAMAGRVSKGHRQQ